MPCGSCATARSKSPGREAGQTVRVRRFAGQGREALAKAALPIPPRPTIAISYTVGWIPSNCPSGLPHKGENRCKQGVGLTEWRYGSPGPSCGPRFPNACSICCANWGGIRASGRFRCGPSRIGVAGRSGITSRNRRGRRRRYRRCRRDVVESFALYANGRYENLLEMYVAPEHRSSGLGAQLLRNAAAYGRRAGGRESK